MAIYVVYWMHPNPVKVFVIITKKIKKNSRSSPFGLSIEKARGDWLHPLNEPYVIGTGLGIGIWLEMG